MKVYRQTTLLVFVIMALFVVFVSPTSARKKVDSLSWKVSLTEGERYLKHGRLKKAELAFREALKEQKHSGSKSRDDRVLCIESLADVLMREDRIDEPLSLYKKSLKILKRAHGRKSPKIVPTLIKMGKLYESEGDYKKSVDKYFLKALEIVEKSDGRNSLKYAECEHLVGRVRVEQELLSHAENRYFDALAIVMRQKELPNAEFLEELLSDYIDLLRSTEDNGKVLSSKFQKELLKDRIDAVSRRVGVKDSLWSKKVSVSLLDRGAPPPTGARKKQRSTNVSASPVVSSGKVMSDKVALENLQKQRIAFYERMIEVDIKSLGRDHPSVARDLTGLAYVYLYRKDYEEAKPLLKRALKIYEDSYKPDTRLINQTKLLLQIISEESSPLSRFQFVSYIDQLPQIPLQAQKLEVALRLNYLAFLAYCQGKIDSSRDIYFWGLSSCAHSSGEKSLLSAAAMLDLSRVLRLSNRSKEAKRYEANARSIWRKELTSKRASLLP